jgi:hypothetical protein
MYLFYYYNCLQTDSLPGLGRGRDKHTKALNFLLKAYYSNWETRSSLQQKRWERLKKNVDQGRWWCTLAQYLGLLPSHTGASILPSAAFLPAEKFCRRDNDGAEPGFLRLVLPRRAVM